MKVVDSLCAVWFILLLSITLVFMVGIAGGFVFGAKLPGCDLNGFWKLLALWVPSTIAVWRAFKTEFVQWVFE